MTCSNSGQNILSFIWQAVKFLTYFNLHNYLQNFSFPVNIRYVTKLNGMNIHAYQFPDPYKLSRNVNEEICAFMGTYTYIEKALMYGLKPAAF